MNMLTGIFQIVLFALLFIFPCLIYLNIRKYKTAALSLLFSRKNQTIRAFQFFAVAMIIYAVNTVIRILNNFYPVLSNLYLFASIILTIFLIYVFYKLYRIMKV